METAFAEVAAVPQMADGLLDHAVLARQLRLPAIFSFDCQFDQVPGLQRREE